MKILELLEEMHPDAGCELDYGTRFQLLCAVVLSAQTTDRAVNKVTPVLFSRWPDAAAMAAADPADIGGVIASIGLWKNKSKNLSALAQMLVSEYGGQVPESFESLVSLPGVGRKTANVVLSEGFGQQRIAVDTHVFRVANRLGLACADSPEDTEEELMRAIPEEKWSRAHHLLIFQGRYVCAARKPDCGSCLLTGHCEYYRQK